MNWVFNFSRVFMQDPKQNGICTESSSKRRRRFKVMWGYVCPAEGLVYAFVSTFSLRKGAGVVGEQAWGRGGEKVADTLEWRGLPAPAETSDTGTSSSTLLFPLINLVANVSHEGHRSPHQCLLLIEFWPLFVRVTLEYVIPSPPVWWTVTCTSHTHAHTHTMTIVVLFLCFSQPHPHWFS